MDRIYPVQGMASCPPSKNVPTAVDTIADLKRHRLFDKSVEHYLWKGMKPFPALAPTLLGETMQLVCLAYIFIHGSYIPLRPLRLCESPLILNFSFLPLY